MENASKALIIVGEVLIAIIILSILVAVIVSFGRYSSDMHKKISDQETYQFNSNFLSYPGRVNITVQEIVTVINFAKKENDKNELKKSDNGLKSTIHVFIYDSSKANKWQCFFHKHVGESDYKYLDDDEYVDIKKYNNKLNNFIKENNTRYFSCAVIPANIMVDKSKSTWKVSINGNISSGVTYNDDTKKINAIYFYPISAYNVTDLIEFKQDDY